MKLSATVKEAAADAEVEISQEEAAQAGSGAPGSRTRQDGRPEQPDVCQERRQGGCFNPLWGDNAGVIFDGMLFARAE